MNNTSMRASHFFEGVFPRKFWCTLQNAICPYWMQWNGDEAHLKDDFDLLESTELLAA